MSEDEDRPASTPEETPEETPASVGAGASGDELRMALEAILLVVDEPVGDVALAQVLETPREAVHACLEALAEEYAAAGRGFVLRHVAGGWRLYTAPEAAAYVERFVLEGQTARLSQAALETLAVIAYMQPVSRGRISAIRGVSVDGVMRTLQSRGLIEQAGEEGPGGAALFRTTRLFLERIGVDSVTDLPDLAPLLPDVATFLSEQESMSR